ncbi:MAG: STAS domain-containing protein, partial [Woeseiaceae bacterium]
MSEFTLEDRGDGCFALSGEMSFDTAERILKKSEEPFEEHTQLEIDLSGVTLSDSAGLAL